MACCVWRVLKEFDPKEATNLVSLPNCVKQMLDKFSDVMLEELPNELPLRKWIDHAIKVISGMAPLTKAPYRMTHEELKELNVATLALGSWPRQGVARLRAKRKTHESHHMLLGMPKSVREWTLTLQSEFPCWELEFRMDSQTFIAQFRGKKSLPWRFLYIIGKLLKRRCLKWVFIAHLDIWNTSYGQKKGQESNWQFDSWPLKVWNRPNFLACELRETYCWKGLDQKYNFASDLITIGGLHAKLCALKVVGVPVVRILGFPLGSPGTKKSHLDVAPMERHRVYYKGEGGGFPQV
jgi:hypothetical protein